MTKTASGYIVDRGSKGLLHRSKDLILDDNSLVLVRGPSVFDHFTYGAGAFNSHVPQNWVTTETGAATPFAPGAAALGGLAVGVTGATTNNAEEFAGKNVGFKASTMGPLVFEMRAKFVGATTPADGDFYFGWADAVTYTNGLSYVLSAASAFTTSAPSDFVGFGYTSIATSGAAFVTGGNPVGAVTTKATVDTFTPLSDGIAGGRGIKDSNFHTYRVVVDTSGSAAFFRDHQFVGGVAAATTAATAVVPYVDAIAKNSHAQTVTIDYIFAGACVV